MTNATEKIGSKSKENEVSKRKWFTFKDAALHLGVTLRALEGYVRRRQLPWYKPFGRILFDIDELNSLVVASRYGGIKCQ